jgi:valyl-tRNA synthetase
MVHPEDERYKKLIGQNALTSLFNVKVPIIADENVKIDKGSGAVMCCTFGDETDILWFKNHNLPLRVIIDKSGKIIDNSWVNDRTSYDELIGLNIKQARAKTLEILKDQNLLIKSEEITHFVKCAERSGCPIEIIVTPQWFIKIVDFKKELKEKAEECNWYPAFMKIRINQWIESISWDWCISRQRFFGVNFPIWYSKRKGEEGKVLIANFDQLPCDPSKALPKGYKEEEVEAETDIMDTWATSSISPQLSSGSINDDLNLGDLNRHKKLFPADLRPQAHEIIRSWAFYTIVKALHHENSIPWKNLMISGWCLASDKTKMSKSKGNVVTPNALIKEKGSDIVRYWASTSNLGSDTAYSEDVLKIGSKLLNKLFNASKFVCTNFQDLSTKPTSATQDINNGRISQKTDLWILSKAYETIKKASKDFDVFEYAKARDKIEDFFWNDFCDNYLEIAKVRSYGLNAQKYQDQELSGENQIKIKDEQQSAILTLYYCLNAITKLFAPFLPHICEELYQTIFKEIEGKISVNERGSWPNLDDFYYNESLADKGNVVLQIIAIIRKFKSDNNLSLKTNIKYFDIKTNINITDFIEDLKNVTNSDKINIINSQEADLEIINITT